MSISTWATAGSSAHTWSTTRRTAAHGPHQSALKCTTVGPVVDRPRSEVSTSAASRPRARIIPDAQRDQPPDHVGDAERGDEHREYDDDSEELMTV